MKVDQYLIPHAVSYNTETFYNILEANMSYIKSTGSIQTYPVTAEQVAIYKSDCYSLFNTLHIHPSMHWVTMRASGMNSPYEFNESIPVIVVPDENVIDQMNQLYRQVTGNIGL